MNSIIDGYTEDAEYLIPSFESINSSELLSHVSEYIPKSGRLVEIGAGTGRDAAWLASNELKVLAVEPVAKFRCVGKKLHTSSNIDWIDDSLPTLSKVRSLEKFYDAALLVSVWQHIKPDDIYASLENLRSILNQDAKLIMSLRLGPGSLKRKCYATSPQETVRLAEQCGFTLVASYSADSVQKSNQNAGVTWVWLVFEVN